MSERVWVKSDLVVSFWRKLRQELVVSDEEKEGCTPMSKSAADSLVEIHRKLDGLPPWFVHGYMMASIMWVSELRKQA